MTAPFAAGSNETVSASKISTEVVTISLEQQYPQVRPDSKSALAVHFELKKDWHFYASADTAPGGMNLKLKPAAKKHINFGTAVFPEPKTYFDKFSNTTLYVFSDKFTAYLPFSIEAFDAQNSGVTIDVNIAVDGAVCSDIQCRMPDFGQLTTKIQIDKNAAMSQPGFTIPKPTAKAASTVGGYNYSLLFALGLALLAGLSLNIMPCVWPVLPLIVMRLVEQSKQSRAKATALGLAFCLGILLFFAGLATANIILQIFYGTVLQWGDQFRNPAFVAAMALLLMVLALFMFDVFTITIPSSIAGKSSAATGFTGAVGMGFLAAVLSTPCSFAILATAFAWAQAQPLVTATLAIMVIGIGMAMPYAILTSMPGLLKRTPRPGRWMELFKQAVGFILLIIAIKLVAAIPQARRMSVLYFAVVLAFSIWMWGSWVDYNTKAIRKWLIRIIAVVLAVAAGRLFLSAPAPKLIDWQKYDAELIQTSIAEQRPVLIKFTADWCLTCQAVEKTVYSRQDIGELIKRKNVLAIKADTTANDYPATIALKEVYREPGVPVSILFVPNKAEPVRWRGMFFADELKSLLEALADR